MMKTKNIIGEKITLGSDPELFLFDPHQNKFISSIGIVGGSKWQPLPLDEPGFFVQEDNVLVEFNIPPANTEGEFVSYLSSGMDQIKNRIPGLELKVQASVFMPADQLEDPSAKMFGCDPDYNAWTGKMNNPPSDEAKKATLRSAGGHVSVGYDLMDEDVDKMEVNMNIVKWLDLRLGVPSILLDKDKHRRQLYGKAGAFRHKPFGVEYRTLSSFWLGNQKLMRWVYQNTIQAVKDAGNELFIDEKTGNKVQQCINNSDENLAMELCLIHNLEIA